MNSTNSAQVRAEIKVISQKVLLAFSCGKDSLATWLQLRDDGFEVVPYFCYLIPDLGFV
jgi:tRNA(Ile)-lysidine synthase TilS/MesJ